MAQFYCVAGWREFVWLRRPQGGRERAPLWDFLPDQRHWLTSLVYAPRMGRPPGARLLDCGAWSYKHEPAPRWSPEAALSAYRAAGAASGDLVVAPDHMVLRDQDSVEEARRGALTVEFARAFLARCRQEARPGLVPVAVTHGNTPDAHRRMAEALLGMGYRALATGGVAGRAGNRRYVEGVLDATARLRDRAGAPFRWHVLGVSALSWVQAFDAYGVDSFDGSSMYFAALAAGEYFWWDADAGRIRGKGKGPAADPESLPVCACPVCARLREDGVDTRRKGTNEHNMGRAIHNVYVYLQALRHLREETGPGLRQARLDV